MLAAEADSGYDVDALIARRVSADGPRSVRRRRASSQSDLDPELRDQLLERAKTEGTTTSEVIREALRRFLKAA